MSRNETVLAALLVPHKPDSQTARAVASLLNFVWEFDWRKDKICVYIDHNADGILLADSLEFRQGIKLKVRAVVKALFF